MLLENAKPDETAEFLWESCVHKIGNLTLTGYNSEMGNKSFAEKKKGYLNRNLKLNEDFFASEKWTKDEIQERTDKLVKDIMKYLDVTADGCN